VTRRMRLSRRVAASLFAALLLAAASAALWRGVRGLDRPLHLSTLTVYRVLPGASLAHVAADLTARGVLRDPHLWVWYARWHGLAAAVRAGEYAIRPGTTPRGLLQQMVKGEVLLHTFTIVDGWRVADLLAALRRDSYLRTTLPPMPADLMAKFAAPGESPEGQFLPETYKFPLGTSDVALLAMAHKALLAELQSAWKQRDANLPLQDPEQLLIVASIVEKETALPAERQKIAGVYLHRLAIGMRLQADPTIIYGLGERYGGSLHSADLRHDGPYNTYTRAGLPPTPIALAGAAAIEASAHPEIGDALYFVASEKGDGSHIFSATLAQQDAAVGRYLSRLRRKAAEGGGK